MYAEAAARQLAVGSVKTTTDHLHEIRGIAQDALREMRVLIFELRQPVLVRDGLAVALQSRLESVESQLGIATGLDTNLEGRLSADIEDGLYRIAQEALNNALKHAHAGRVKVSLRQTERTVTLEVSDDGMGFDVPSGRQKGGFGLRGMEERAARMGGRLAVHSTTHEGTRVRVEVDR